MLFANKLALAVSIAVASMALTGCDDDANAEKYVGATKDKPCIEQYKEPGNIDRCIYDVGQHTN